MVGAYAINRRLPLMVGVAVMVLELPRGLLQNNAHC